MFHYIRGRTNRARQLAGVRGGVGAGVVGAGVVGAGVHLHKISRREIMVTHIKNSRGEIMVTHIKNSRGEIMVTHTKGGSIFFLFKDKIPPPRTTTPPTPL